MTERLSLVLALVNIAAEDTGVPFKTHFSPRAHPSFKFSRMRQLKFTFLSCSAALGMPSPVLLIVFWAFISNRN